MRVLRYHTLDPRPVQASYDRVVAALAQGDLRSPNVKKLTGHPYYRAKLSDTHRLLLTFCRYQGETVCLILDVILNHRYEKSRFLRGAQVREDLIEQQAEVPTPEPVGTLRYVNPGSTTFHVLDKPVVFDDEQDAVYTHPLPVVVVGSAGSGKTAITLERLRDLPGAAYVTLSRYLAQQAESLYTLASAPGRRPRFLALQDALNEISPTGGREVTYRDFEAWFAGHRATHRTLQPHALYEEIRGVITGAAAGPLSEDAYLALGERQALYAREERPAVYALYQRYRAWLASRPDVYDPNLAAHDRLPLARPRYTALVIDEVQDMTAVQFTLLRRLLIHPDQLLVSGDANQVIYPSGFSWALLRGLFREEDTGGVPQRVTVLNANYRNAREITRVANRLLTLRTLRYGSIDRESHTQARSTTAHEGQVTLLPETPDTVRDLDAVTRSRTDTAVIVLQDEDKPAARRVFKTPLVFSVPDIKGLEYRHVVLYNLISDHAGTYRDVAGTLTVQDLDQDAAYARSRDRHDVGGNRARYHLNALYVALTRGEDRVTLLERDPAHPLLTLLTAGTAAHTRMDDPQDASRADWARAERTLRAQGRTEQADAILQDVLKLTPVPWQPIDAAHLWTLVDRAIENNAKAIRNVLEFAIWHLQTGLVTMLASLTRNAEAVRLNSHVNERFILYGTLRTKLLQEYVKTNIKSVLWDVDRYGVDFRSPLNLTPLMLAASAGNAALIRELLARGADPTLTDTYGHTALHAALQASMLDEADNRFTRTRLEGAWDLLAPDALHLRVGEEPVTFDRGSDAYLVWQLMYTATRGLMYAGEQGGDAEGLDSQDLYLEGEAHSPLTRTADEVDDILDRYEARNDHDARHSLWIATNANSSPKQFMLNPEVMVGVERDGIVTWENVYTRLNGNPLSLPFAYLRHAIRVMERDADGNTAHLLADLPTGVDVPLRDPARPVPYGGDDATQAINDQMEIGKLIDDPLRQRHVQETLLDIIEHGQAYVQDDPTTWPWPYRTPYQETATELLIHTRRLIPDDHGRLHALTDTEQGALWSASLDALGDAGLHALLQYQNVHKIRLEAAGEKALIQNGFSRIAATLKARYATPANSAGPGDALSERAPQEERLETFGITEELARDAADTLERVLPREDGAPGQRITMDVGEDAPVVIHTGEIRNTLNAYLPETTFKRSEYTSFTAADRHAFLTRQRDFLERHGWKRHEMRIEGSVYYTRTYRVSTDEQPAVTALDVTRHLLGSVARAYDAKDRTFRVVRP